MRPQEIVRSRIEWQFMMDMGAEAFREGKRMGDCPYELDCNESAWCCGYLAAKVAYFKDQGCYR